MIGNSEIGGGSLSEFLRVQINFLVCVGDVMHREWFMAVVFDLVVKSWQRLINFF